jgi:O-antigen biosynthesis protein
MRVAILSHNARTQDAVGNQIAEKVRFFQERGAEVRLFVENGVRLHPDVKDVACIAGPPTLEGPDWQYLCGTDLIFAVYGQYHQLLQYLPCLEGEGPRIVFDYQGVTPASLVHEQMRDAQRRSERQRGYVWCADHALTASQFALRELVDATRFPDERMTTLPLPVDVTCFGGPSRDRFLQQRLGIDGAIVLYIGRLAANKRVPLLIEALAGLDRSVHAVIVGDVTDVYAEEASTCLQCAQRLGVAGRVHFLGQLDDAELARAYRGADVLVIPSRHEAFCVPLIEAMAAGVPVIAARSAAMPETVGDAGLTFVPENADDLAANLRRVLDDRVGRPLQPGPRRVAIVSFRFGPDIGGGAETSLRTMAEALHSAGHHVEILTTCTRSESRWTNELPTGTTLHAGMPVHRYPIDPHDADAHGEIFRATLEKQGSVSADLEERYLHHSIHSTALLEALASRHDEFDAIVTGPYLFGLTADLLHTFPGQVLLAPCFHDEPLARLAVWPRLASQAGGILYHSAEEQHFAQARLGVNHPNSHEIGAQLGLDSATQLSTHDRPYVVYCGRYSEQKNVPLLLEWLRQYQAHHPGDLDVVFMGEGNVRLPSAPWLRDLGRVNEPTKRSVLAGACALIQLSTHESLSLVALEAWREGTPVIAHRDCAVLRAPIDRSEGGAAVDGFDVFAGTLNDLRANPAAWRARGARGRAYVIARYGSATQYVETMLAAIEQMHQPLRAQMRRRGFDRAQRFARQRWKQSFGDFVDRVLMHPARPKREVVLIEPMRKTCQVASGTQTMLLPVRLTNVGTVTAVPDGPGRTVIGCANNGADPEQIPLAGMLMPGDSLVAALPIAMPDSTDLVRIRLWTQRVGASTPAAKSVEIEVVVADASTPRPDSCVSAYLETLHKTLPRTQELQQLPSDYVDVTEGTLAPVKRFVKRKLLHNFKHAYVDVLSRQQSEVNGQVVLMLEQLTECCAMLDHAVQGLHRRLDAMEERFESMSDQKKTVAPIDA